MFKNFSLDILNTLHTPIIYVSKFGDIQCHAWVIVIAMRSLQLLALTFTGISSSSSPFHLSVLAEAGVLALGRSLSESSGQIKKEA